MLTNMIKFAAAIALLAILASIGITVYVEREAAFTHESLGGDSVARALVLFHPSRDAHFSDDLSMALAKGLVTAGYSVDRETLTEKTKARPNGYALIAVVSNTFWATPDMPTLSYLKRAKLSGIPTIGLIGGAGSTARSQRVLDQALRKSGAAVILTRSLWISKPNDETRANEPNRDIAMQIASQIGTDTGRRILAANNLPPPPAP
jgi:hypothetical protein